MMNVLFNVLHPAFDVLSTYTDLSDLDAARSRVGRHLSRCAECRQIVAEIRQLGVSAREAAVDGAPEGLWSRIELAAKEEKERPAPRDTPPPDAEPWEAAPSLRPTRHWRVPTKASAARIGISLAIAASALIAVVLATGTRRLIASAPGRLVITPFRPAPGSRVHVRFTPSPKLSVYDEVVLIGQYSKGAMHQRTDFWFGGAYDSLATLRRTTDGAMVGDFLVPSDFKAVSLIVGDPGGRVWDADGPHSWMLVGGDSMGRPVLSSLLAAISVDALYGSPSRAAVLDTLQKYFPAHPAGFATAGHYRGLGVFSTLLKFFQSAEGKYLSFNSKLEQQPSLDADRITAMIDFATQIQEPAEAAKWTRRLVREHPSDPRAVRYYAQMLHEIELKEPPADTIRPYLAMFDTLFERADTNYAFQSSPSPYYFADRYGDEAMQRRWALRTLQRAGNSGDSNFGNMFSVLGASHDKWLRDPEIRATAASLLRSASDVGCEQPKWQPRRNWMSPESRKRYCLNYRAQALTKLSTIALLDGRVVHALALADSSVALFGSTLMCRVGRGRKARGEALLAKGDTLGAAYDFALAFAGDSWQFIDARKAMVKRMGASVDSARWAAFDRAAAADAGLCQKAAAEQNRLDRLQEMNLPPI